MSNEKAGANLVGPSILMAMAGFIVGVTNSIYAMPVAVVLMALATFALGRTSGFNLGTGAIAGGLSALCGGGGLIVGSFIRGI
jgi:hypothetical protein